MWRSSPQAVRGMLDNPNEPVSDLSYFDCIESIMENSKVRPPGETADGSETSAVCTNGAEHPQHSSLGPMSCHPFICSVQVLGESMAGISQNCKTGDVPAFGDCVGSASKALCGLTEAAGQVQTQMAFF